MGFFDRLFGGSDEPRPDRHDSGRPQGVPSDAARDPDEVALERYRYLLRTAPPEQIERAHEDAFAKLTPQQRSQVFVELAKQAPPGDTPRADDAHSLARAATRTELQKPGTLERSFGHIPTDGAQPNGADGSRRRGGAVPGFGAGAGLGSMFGASLLGSVAGYVVGSAVMASLLPGFGDLGEAGGDVLAAGGDALGGAGDAGFDMTGGFRDAGGDQGDVTADGGGFFDGGFGAGDGGFGGGDGGFDIGF